MIPKETLMLHSFIMSPVDILQLLKRLYHSVNGDLCRILCAGKTIFWRFLVLDSIDSSETIISQF